MDPGRAVGAAGLLLVPAPSTTPARHRLHAALAAARPYPITAILNGPWPAGTTLHLDTDHRVLEHTPPPTLESDATQLSTVREN
ncbi:hypothetical protein GCM10010464_53590 [Pseudonocardia yunnanensis]